MKNRRMISGGFILLFVREEILCLVSCKTLGKGGKCISDWSKKKTCDILIQYRHGCILGGIMRIGCRKMECTEAYHEILFEFTSVLLCDTVSAILHFIMRNRSRRLSKCSN